MSAAIFDGIAMMKEYFNLAATSSKVAEKSEDTALEAKAPSRWRRQKRSKDFSTAYSMNLASKLTPEASPGDALLLTWRCSDYEPHQFWRRACKARIAGSG